MFAAIPVSYAGDRVPAKRTAKAGTVASVVAPSGKAAKPAGTPARSGNPSVVAVKSPARKPDVAQAPRKAPARKPVAIHTPGA